MNVASKSEGRVSMAGLQVEVHIRRMRNSGDCFTSAAVQVGPMNAGIIYPIDFCVCGVDGNTLRSDDRRPQRLYSATVTIGALEKSRSKINPIDLPSLCIHSDAVRLHQVEHDCFDIGTIDVRAPNDAFRV